MDKLEKYLLIPSLFPNKAGKLKSLLEVQKRLVLELSKTKHSDGVNKLLLSVAESYDVADDFINWNYKIIKGLESDAQMLKDGARMRNVIQDQSDFIVSLMDQDRSVLNEIRERLRKKDESTGTGN